MPFQPRNNRDILLSTIFFSISFAPSPFGFAMFFAFIPQIRLYLRNSIFDSIICGYVIGLLSNMLVLYWVANFSITYFSIGVLLNALKFAVFAAVISALGRSSSTVAVTLFPLLWTSLEFLREIGPLAFSWLNISYSQTDYLRLIQFAEYTGNLGIVFWICLINLLLILIWDSRFAIRKLIILVGVLLIFFGIPLWHSEIVLSQHYRTPAIKAVYIQPDIRDKSEKQFENLTILLAQSQHFRGYEPDVIIWPETALPFYFFEEKDPQQALSAWSDRTGIAVLTGILNRKNGHRYNAATLIEPHQSNSSQVYHKLVPVPMAETGLWGIARDSSDISSGTSYTVFSLNIKNSTLVFEDKTWNIGKPDLDSNTVSFSVLICFETAFAELSRQMVDKGAQFLVFITNDQVFGFSSQPYQHVALARMRAIENRIAIVQCANTGVSAFIDPFGQMSKRSALFSKQAAIQHIPLKIKSTIYTRYGIFYGWIILGLAIASIVLTVYRGGRV